MSHPQPTSQDDDQTAAVNKVIALALKDNLGYGYGWIAPHIRLALKSAGYELVNQVGTIKRTEKDFSGSLTGDALDKSATLVESIARWLGERESTHLWPEIHESDKACYRDAARHLVATVKFSLSTSVQLPEPDDTPTGEGYEGCLGEWRPLDEACLAAWSDGKPAITAEFYVGDLTTKEARNLAAALLAAAAKVEAGE